MVDPTPEIEKERKSELDKLAAHYGGGSGVDMTAFPSFKFEGNLLGRTLHPSTPYGVDLIFC